MEMEGGRSVQSRKRKSSPYSWVQLLFGSLSIVVSSRGLGDLGRGGSGLLGLLLPLLGTALKFAKEK